MTIIVVAVQVQKRPIIVKENNFSRTYIKGACYKKNRATNRPNLRF